MPQLRQFELKLYIYSHAPNDGEGMCDYTGIPCGGEETLFNAYKLAYACADSIEGLIAKDQEAHRMTIWQGEQIVASADVTSFKDDMGRRFFTTDSLAWRLPPNKVEATQIAEGIEANQKIFDLFDSHEPGGLTANEQEVIIDGLRNQLNFSACPIARTTLQTTLYKAETALGLRSSITRHFCEDLNL